MGRLFIHLTDYGNPNSYASRLRAKRARRLMTLIDEVHAAKGSCRILDVGGTERYWSIFDPAQLRRRNVSITLLNLDRVELKDRGGLFVSVVGDGCDMQEYPPASFDLVHSNSVIEHVGLWPAMQAMAGEVRRVGRAYFVQTPYYWFPIEPHYFGVMLHWLPLSWRVKLALRMRLGNWPRASSVAEAVEAQQSAQLLDVTMMRALFPDARLHRERWFGLTKSLMAIRRGSSSH